jgi:hypothetical protein
VWPTYRPTYKRACRSVKFDLEIRVVCTVFEFPDEFWKFQTVLHIVKCMAEYGEQCVLGYNILFFFYNIPKRVVSKLVNCCRRSSSIQNLIQVSDFARIMAIVEPNSQ